MVFVPVKGKYHLQEETLKGNFGLLNQCLFGYMKYNLLSSDFDIDELCYSYHFNLHIPNLLKINEKILKMSANL